MADERKNLDNPTAGSEITACISAQCMAEQARLDVWQCAFCSSFQLKMSLYSYYFLIKNVRYKIEQNAQYMKKKKNSIEINCISVLFR